MLTYTADALRSINRDDLRPVRSKRRAIFGLRLWKRTRAGPALSHDAGSKQSYVNKQSDGILVGLLNTQTLAKNRPIAISDTIATRHLDIMALTETWHHASDDIPLKRCAPPGFSIVNAARSDAGSTSSDAERGGGIAIIHSDRFAAKKMVFDIKPTTFEVLACSFRSASVTIVHVVIYRPGSKPATDRFFTELIALLEIVATFRNEIVITGDFNVHVNDATDWHARRLAEILESFGLLQTVAEPTHWQGNTLDLVITRANGRPTMCTVDPPKAISDHALIVCQFPPVQFAVRQVYRSVRPWKKVDRAAFRKSLETSALCADVEELRSKTVDELFDTYENTLRRLADYYAPAANRLQRTRRLSVWFDEDCRCSRRRARLLERRYRKSKADIDRNAWIAQVRTMHSLYQHKENLYWSTCIANNTGNQRKLWRSVSSVLKRDRNATSASSSLTADKLSSFFKNKIDGVRATTASADPPVYSPSAGNKLAGFREYTAEEVRRVLVQSPPKTSMVDPIPTDVLLESIDIILPYISTMCNASLRDGILPASQKAAVITPILKKANLDVDDVKSYRPISNLTFISKVIERIAAQQIKAFLAESDLMPPLQSAYRSGHSTETATLKVLSDVLDAVDSQETTLLGLLDMSAAFDTVDFEILLRRLETSYRLSGTVLMWLTSFVTDRTQVVAFDGSTSSPVRLICGVPQGSVLGPLLFVLYAAEVMNIANNHGVRIHAYADDLQIYVSCDAVDQQAATSRLLSCVKDIGCWMSSNRLKLNADKTEFIWLGTRQQLLKISRQPLDVGGAGVVPVDRVRDLGVIIDDELTMTAHVSHVISGCFYQLRQLRSVRRCLPFEARRALVTAFVSGRLDYCNAVLYGVAAGSIHRLQVVMNAAARLVTGTGRHEHITPVLRDVLHWLPVQQRIHFKIAALAFNCVRGVGPAYFGDVCIPLMDISGRASLRSAGRGDLLVPRTKTKIGSRSFRVAAPTVWNSLPHHLHETTLSREQFRNGLKTHLFRAAYG